MKSSVQRLFVGTFVMLFFVGTSPAAVLSQDFEGLTLAGTTTPANWSYVEVDADPQNGYVTIAGNPSGLAGQVTGNHASNNSQIPGAYIVNSGDLTFSAAHAVAGTFDYRITTASSPNYSNAMFFFGDIADGLTETVGGEYIGIVLRRSTFAARSTITNGVGTTLATASGNIVMDAWASASFTWTPTSGNTGDLSFTTNSWTLEYDGFTFDSPDLHFGFGSGGYFGVDMTGAIDNISITGTAIPEPTAALLGSLGLLGLLRRRRD